MNQIRMTLAALVCCIMAAQAQTEEFTVATLNVDGLPQKLIIPVNPDGPGEKYTPEIADFLLNKKYDIIGIQENFNYYDYLFPKLDAAGYSHDRCYSKIELENFRYPYPNDGINAIWRKGIKGERTDSVAWTESYGIISHANDGLTNKGFRRYELTLDGGSQIVIYNGHWDASSDFDDMNGEDGPDRRVRMQQWRQMRDSILNHLDSRPVIIMGDANSYYCRDSIKLQVIDEIEDSGRAKVYDAWIEMEQGGIFPEMVEGVVFQDPGARGNVRKGEMLDKILFLNPTDGGKLTALTYRVDSVDYVRSDSTSAMLGDHFPVSVRFRIEGAGKDTAIHEIQTDRQQQEAYYDLKGRRLDGLPSKKGIYIHRGKKIVVK